MFKKFNRTFLSLFIALALVLTGCQSNNGIKFKKLPVNEIIEQISNSTTIHYATDENKSGYYEQDINQIKTVLSDIEFNVSTSNIESKVSPNFKLTFYNGNNVNSISFFNTDTSILVGTCSYHLKNGSNEIYVPIGYEYFYEITQSEYEKVLELFLN